MFENGRMTRAAAATLASAAAAVLALTGCSSGNSSPASASSSRTSASGATVSASPPVSAPSWAAALGPAVTVRAPAPAAPGNGSPAEAMAGWAKAYHDKQLSELCPYLPPRFMSQCKATAQVVDSHKSTMPYTRNMRIGYAVTDGTEAVVGTTGAYCIPGATPLCATNNDPAAIFSSGKQFASLFRMAIAGTNSSPSKNSYTPYPCVEIGGKWYVDLNLG